MIPFNPGNILPFFEATYSTDDERWQRHRQAGTDNVPYGLPCPRTRLLPFQLYITGAAPANVTEWDLRSPVDDSSIANLDETQLTIEEKADSSGYWVTWYADEELTVIPECGFCYMRLEIDGRNFYSEVMYADSVCGLESAKLQVTADSCAVDGSSFSFQLATDIAAQDGYTYTIQRKSGLLWVTIATNTTVSVVETSATETRQYRVVCTSPCGVITTTQYTATWTNSDPCGTFTLGTGTTSLTYVTGGGPGSLLGSPAAWRMEFTNDTDKGNVLYQNGYTQHLYLPMPVWDVPEIQREIEVKVNGNGVETKRFTRTIERRGFEVADVPDYVIGFLTKAGDLDSIVYNDVKTDVQIPLENLTFESRRQGPALNIGRFYFEAEAEAFADCQENYTLA